MMTFSARGDRSTGPARAVPTRVNRKAWAAVLENNILMKMDLLAMDAVE